MILKQFNFSSRLRRLAAGSLLAPHLDDFVENLSSMGFTQGSLKDVVAGAIHFGVFLTAKGLSDASQLEQAHLDGYLLTQPSHRCRGYRYCFSRGTRGAKHVVRYLRSAGIAGPNRPPPAPQYLPLLQEWLSHLDHHRGLADGSIRLYQRHIVRFLESLGPEATRQGLSRVGVEQIRRYLGESTREGSLSQRKAVTSTLRIFLRFAWRCGWTGRDLSPVVLSPPSFRQQTLPRGPRWDDVLRLPATADRSTGGGRRNYAILMVLITYGVRAGQLCSLRLEDVNWRSNKLHFSATKRGKRLELPLIAPVGEALFDYLRQGRPSSASRAFFLSTKPPFKEVTTSAIYTVVSGAFRQAGIQTPHLGSHAIRHAWATRMINQGQPLKTIADLLGHRSLETTRLYAKLDLVRLREVGLPWPKELL